MVRLLCGKVSNSTAAQRIVEGLHLGFRLSPALLCGDVGAFTNPPTAALDNWHSKKQNQNPIQQASAFPTLDCYFGAAQHGLSELRYIILCKTAIQLVLK